MFFIFCTGKYVHQQKSIVSFLGGITGVHGIHSKEYAHTSFGKYRVYRTHEPIW